MNIRHIDGHSDDLHELYTDRCAVQRKVHVLNIPSCDALKERKMTSSYLYGFKQLFWWVSRTHRDTVTGDRI